MSVRETVNKDEMMNAIFGFKPTGGGNATARLIEVVIIQRKLEELAGKWKNAHDRITDIRGKYQKDAPTIGGEEASEDHARIVKLEQDRTDANMAWAKAYDAARDAGYVVSHNDISYWAKPAATVA